MSDPKPHDFFGIDLEVDQAPVTLRFIQKPLKEQFIDAAEAMSRNHGGPRHEFHNPRCPKLSTRGEKACRCGAEPLEAVFEDSLEDFSPGEE